MQEKKLTNHHHHHHHTPCSAPSSRASAFLIENLLGTAVRHHAGPASPTPDRGSMNTVHHHHHPHYHHPHPHGGIGRSTTTRRSDDLGAVVTHTPDTHCSWGPLFHGNTYETPSSEYKQSTTNSFTREMVHRNTIHPRL